VVVDEEEVVLLGHGKELFEVVVLKVEEDLLVVAGQLADDLDQEMASVLRVLGRPHEVHGGQWETDEANSNHGREDEISWVARRRLSQREKSRLRRAYEGLVGGADSEEGDSDPSFGFVHMGPRYGMAGVDQRMYVGKRLGGPL
jgi:hypothetical protein